jgi:hypothetical protein
VNPRVVQGGWSGGVKVGYSFVKKVVAGIPCCLEGSGKGSPLLYVVLN